MQGTLAQEGGEMPKLMIPLLYDWRSLLACLVVTFTVSSIVASTASGQDLKFRRVIVDEMPDGHAIASGDFDGDGDLDFVATSEAENSVVWFQNKGSFRFVSRVIADNLGRSYPLSVGDLDQDGKTDVLAAGYGAGKYVWYKNKKGEAFSGPRLIGKIDGPHSIVPVDIDKDGDVDVLTGAQDGNRVAWYENDGGENFVENVIDDEFPRTKTAYPAYLDQDGRIDVVATSFSQNAVVWYRQKKDGSFEKFVIRTDFLGAYFALPADIDDDGDIDIVVASKDDNTISWLRNDGRASGERRLLFKKKTLDTNCTGARSVDVGDLDGDDDPDIVAACRNNPDAQVTWYENLGGGKFASTRIVSADVRGAYGVQIADMNGDSLMDILSVGSRVASVHRQTTPR